MNTTTEKNGLAKLEERLQEELSLLELPAKDWVPVRTLDGHALLDVAIIGGGMAGLTVATALKHLGIKSQAYDRAPEQFDASNIQKLKDIGMDEKEILDLIHSVAIFGWANRLMLNLGEPVFP